MKYKRCLHVYHYFKKYKKLDLINVSIIKTRNTAGRPKLVKPNTSLTKDNFK